MSDRLSIHMEQLDYYWVDFQEIWYLSIFRKTLLANSKLIKMCQE